MAMTDTQRGGVSAARTATRGRRPALAENAGYPSPVESTRPRAVLAPACTVVSRKRSCRGLGGVPNVSTESQSLSQRGRAITAYLWSAEPSRGVVCSVEVFGAVGPEGGRAGAGRRRRGRRRQGGSRWSAPVVVLSVVAGGHGGPASRPRAEEVVAARLSGAWAYLRHAVAAGDMKPCGHDHRELTHVGDRTLGGGSCRFCGLPGGRGPISRRVGETADLAVA